MACHISEELEKAETTWRSQSPEWRRKMEAWEIWKATSAARARALEKSRKQKKKGEDTNDDVPDSVDSWHSSFDPDEPSPQFSFIGRCTSYSTSQLEEDIKGLAWTSTPKWAIAALRRGVAVHHSGMNKHYRSLIENLFRKGFIRVMIATGGSKT